MSGKYLLDTNAAIALIYADPILKAGLREADEILVPCIALGELCFGAQNSAHVEENLQRIENLIENNLVLECDTETARRYGEIKAMLKKKGRPVPGNDLWIAAIAIQRHLILVTRDKHFDQVDGLATLSW